ncbi:NAD-dependent epimerase/dehydratase family protein [Hydrogenophaga flava]|uniref:NAD-dependent epimerase/dehydratase family protein n=1 Tax=Hydrogenophaga flava TaxID=65657 RepID=UPI000826915F|nr:NAD-dependent epimerase/dehydratase family protein [Hydrogenophaga flava]
MNTAHLVTGASGYVAAHLTRLLLEAGHRVNATVRSLGQTAKLRPLQALQQQFPGRLTLFEADLLKPGSFDAAMAGCAVVHHVASPFLLPEKITDGRRQMLEPALQGTRHVLGSVERTPSVQRVVMTSTVGAIFGDYIDVRQMKDGVLSEVYFNTSSTLENNPYHLSKVEAEKEAWRLHGLQQRWSLVTINPGLILGPSLTPESASGSLYLLDEMLRGVLFYGMPDLSLTTVDVREVALAHLRAAERQEAHGRYILAEKEMISFVEISKILRSVHPRPWLLPRHTIPDWVVRLIGPAFGLTPDYIRKHLGIRFPVDNRRSIDELGITYRPIRDTLTEHAIEWLRQRRGAPAPVHTPPTP